MKKTYRNWKKFMAIGLVSGSFLFQAPACNTANVITAVATSITAGGVLFLVDRVID